MAKCKKLLAILLTLAMIVGMVPMSAIMSSAAIDRECVKTFSDDFEDLEYSDGVWSTFDKSGANGTPATPRKIIETDENNYFTPSRSANFLEYFNAFPQGGTLLSLSGKLKSATLQKSYDPYNIVAYYDPEKNAYAALGMYTDGTCTYIKRLNNSNTALNGGSGFSREYDCILVANEWVDFNIEYAFSENADASNGYAYKLTLFLTLTMEDGTTSKRHSFDFFVPSMTNATFGVLGHSTTVYYDDFEATYEAFLSDEEMISLFRLRNAEILTKTEFTIDDLAKIEAALSDYESLSDSAKAEVSAEKTILDDATNSIKRGIPAAFKAEHSELFNKTVTQITANDKVLVYDTVDAFEQLSEFSKECCVEAGIDAELDAYLAAFKATNYKFQAGEDFECLAYSDDVWSTFDKSGANGTPATPRKIIETEENNYFTPSRSANFLEYVNVSPKGATLLGLSGRFYSPTLPKSYDPHNIIAYYDPVNNAYAGLGMYADATTTYISRFYHNTAANGGGGYNRETNCILVANEWVNFDIEYIFSKNDNSANGYAYKLTLFLTLTMEDGTTSNRHSFDFFVPSMTNATFGVLGHSTTTYYDDFKVTYDASSSDVEMILVFRSRNAEILGKTEFTIDDLAKIEAALSDYDALSDDAKATVAAEKAILDIAANSIKNDIPNSFRATHAEFFNKSVSQITINDRSLVFEAASDFEKLSKFSKECCVEAGLDVELEARVSAFYQKNSKFNFEDFEFPAYTDHYWTTEKISGTNDNPATNWSVVNGKLKGSYNSSASSYLGVTTIKDELWPTENLIKKLSFDYYTGGSSYDNSEPVFYYDPISKLTVAWESARSSSTTVSTSRRDYFNDVIADDKNKYDENMVYPNLDLYSNFNGSPTTTSVNYWNENEKGALPEYLHFDVKYNYYPSIVGNYTNGVAVSLLQIRVTISANGETIETRNYNITKKENDTFNGFKFGVLTESSASNVMFDNFVVECELNSADIEELASYYITKHIDVLSLEYNEVKAEHKTAIETALAEYETLHEMLKEALTYEKHVLDAQLSIIAGDYDFDETNIESVRAMFKKVKAHKKYEQIYFASLKAKLVGILSEYAKGKPGENRKIKVACVGDSMTQSAGASAGNEYPAVLGRLLGDDYIVSNFGIGGGRIRDTFWHEDQMKKMVDYQPDIVVLKLGLNDNFGSFPETDDKYYSLIEFYQSLDSCPTVIILSSTWCHSRTTTCSEFQLKTADEFGLPYLDINTLTMNAIQATQDEYLANGVYSEELETYFSENNITDAEEKALLATKLKWIKGGLGNFDDLHYTDYGYAFVANCVYDMLMKYSYVDVRTPLDGLTNWNCYGNAWDSSFENEVNALVDTVASLDTSSVTAVDASLADFDALNDVQKIYFKNEFADSYEKLTMAKAKLDSLEIVELAVNTYVDKYGAFLNKTEFTLVDVQALNMAIADYDVQSDVVKYELAAYKQLLDNASDILTELLCEYMLANGAEEISEGITQYNAMLKAWNKMSGSKADIKQGFIELKKALAEKISGYGENTDANNKIRILCIGDETTEGYWSTVGSEIYSYPAYLRDMLGSNYQVEKVAYSSDATLTSGKFISDENKSFIENYQPNLIILMAGRSDAPASTAANTAEGGKIYNAAVEHIEYLLSIDSNPSLVLATPAKYFNRYLGYISGMINSLAQTYGLPVVDIDALTADWEAYSEETADTTFFTSLRTFNRRAHQAFADEFYKVITGANVEFTTGVMNYVDFSASDFVAKYSNLAETGVTDETLEEYKAMVNEYENMLPKSKEAVTGFRNTISFAETNSSVLENTTTEDAEEVLEIFSNYNEIKDIIDEAEPETAEKIETAITNAGLRPEILGKTLSVSTAPIMGTVAKKPANENYVAMGMVFTSYNSMLEQGVTTLTKETPKALYAERNYEEGASKDETLIFGLKGIMEASDKWGYYIASRSYVVYELEDGTRVTIYNEATHTNPDDANEIDSTAAVRSINSLVKSMATTLYEAGANDAVNTIEGVNEYAGISLKEFCDSHDSAILGNGVDTMKLLIAYKEVFEKIAQ